MIKEIDADNIQELDGIIDPDVSENLVRDCYRAVKAEGGSQEPSAAMVWEFLDKDGGSSVANILQFAAAKNADEIEAGAKELIDYFDEKLFELDVTRSKFEFVDPSETIIKLLEESGFKTAEVESNDLYVKLKDISDIKALNKKTPDYIFEVSRLQDIQLWQGITNCMFAGRKGILNDLSDISLDWFEQDISSCVWTDEMADGLFLIHKTTSGILVPSLLYASEPDSSKNLLLLMRYSLKAAAAKYPPDTKVLLRRHTKSVKAITDKLFPGKEGIKVVAGKRLEEVVS